MKIVLHERGFRLPDFPEESGVELFNTAMLPGDTVWEVVYQECSLCGVHDTERDASDAWIRALTYLTTDCLLIKYTDHWVGYEEECLGGRVFRKVSHQSIQVSLPQFVAHKVSHGNWDYSILAGDPAAVVSRAIHLVKNLALPIRLDLETLSQKGYNVECVREIKQEYFSSKAPYGYLRNSHEFESGEKGLARHLVHELEREFNGLSAMRVWRELSKGAGEIPQLSELNRFVNSRTTLKDKNDLRLGLEKALEALGSIEKTLQEIRRQARGGAE